MVELLDSNLSRPDSNVNIVRVTIRDDADVIRGKSQGLESDVSASSDGKAVNVKKWWKFRMRSFDDNGERDWWFASTAIPLLAATLAPLANVLSIAALVTYWRMNIDDGHGQPGPQLLGRPFKDPRWCLVLNIVSLICGFVGNIFLLFNFTGRVRYILALPLTISLWYIATGILTAITVCMAIYQPPIPPLEVYSQGFWYAVIAAVMYCVCSMLLMVNMLGYFLGHYPQTFDLTDHQRTLILQTMLFFVWLAGGGAVFSTVESRYGDEPTPWTFVDGLYFCDVTILTVGFGDLYPHGDLGRGLVFPYSVGGIIMLGLVITSISKFAGELSEDNVVRRHIDKARTRTYERAISEPDEIKRLDERMKSTRRNVGQPIHISNPMNPRSQAGLPMETSIFSATPSQSQRRKPSASVPMLTTIRNRTVIKDALNRKARKLVVLRDQKDRFDAMRLIQHSTTRFRRWYALTLSLLSFGLLWCVGAIVFWQCEKDDQGMTYFQALYFCYVSLLTIGYGDLAPRSNAGRSFFVVWSLIAVPTMTILINDLGSTVIDSFRKGSSPTIRLRRCLFPTLAFFSFLNLAASAMSHGTFRFADFTILPKEGVYKDWLTSKPKLWNWLLLRKEKKERSRRMKEGIPFPTADVDPESVQDSETLRPQLDTMSQEFISGTQHKHIPDAVLARRLAIAIRRVAADLKSEHADTKYYTFEEWAELSRLIRFTSQAEAEAIQEEEDEGLIEWDWIGEESPMMSAKSEPEFVLDRLCESLSRYMKRVEVAQDKLKAS